MLYYLLRFLFRVTNTFYFKSFQIKGGENIPKKGAVLFVANHPSAFMDPIVIGTVTKRSLYFLAKGALFQSAFTRWLLPKFNIIPVFRKDETPGQSHKNKDTFSQCYKHLAKGGAILIFPEGVSLTERKIKKIQSGAARICLGAEAENIFKLDIKIVPIGLNYSNPHKFQSDLFVNIDKPISVSDYYELYKQDSFKAAHALTDEIRSRLESQVVAIQDSEVDKFVSNIELIYKAEVLQDLGHSPAEMDKDFFVTKTISDCVHYFMEREPLRVAKIKNDIDSYLNDLEHLSLSDNSVKSMGRSTLVFDAIRSLFLLVLGFPLFLFGLLNNYLPFRIPGWLARMISKRLEFFGAIIMTYYISLWNTIAGIRSLCLLLL